MNWTKGRLLRCDGAGLADNFDSLYVVRLTRTGGTITAQFVPDYEGLNNLSTACP